MQVTFLGHAGILIDSGKSTILMDGWFSPSGAFDASWFQLPANHHLLERDWSGLSGVIVSHEHLDHLDPVFLRKVPDATPLYIVSYGSPLFVRKLLRLTGRVPKVLGTDREYAIGDVHTRVWTEPSPMNQDSVWVFRNGDRSIVHTVDSRLSSEQLDEIQGFIGGEPDLLLLQASGASWYPLVYENYSDAVKRERGFKKREQKHSYALSVVNYLHPRTVVICAGPPVFLDPSLRWANDDPSFPTPGESKEWFLSRGYAGRIEVPLPGDRIDLVTGALTEDASVHSAFEWERRHEYTEEYAQVVAPRISEAYQRADELIVPDMDAAIRKHFFRMQSLSPYFNERISMTLRLDVEGPQGGTWLVDFGRTPAVRQGTCDEPYQYRYRMHSRWLKRILVDQVPWEDVLLSLRFSAHRDPDIYNDHLLGLLKFNDSTSLNSVERYDKSLSDESIVVMADDGARYEIARFCPHAGAALDDAPIEGHTITCLNHHYVFDLDTGISMSGNCKLRTRRLSENEIA